MKKIISLEVSEEILKKIDEEAKKEYRTRTSFLIACAMTRIQNKELIREHKEK